MTVVEDARRALGPVGAFLPVRTTAAPSADPPQPPAAAYPRIVAANGPRMVALAGEISDGARPAMREPEFTAEARRLLGPDKLLVVLTRAEGDAAAVSAHLAAGAGHATPGLPVGTDFAAGVDHLERLAPAALRPR